MINVYSWYYSKEIRKKDVINNKHINIELKFFLRQHDKKFYDTIIFHMRGFFLIDSLGECMEWFVDYDQLLLRLPAHKREQEKREMMKFFEIFKGQQIKNKKRDEKLKKV